MRNLLFYISIFALCLLAHEAQSKEELVVYSSRKEHLVKPLFAQYEQEAGVRIRYITDKPGPLIARLKAEGEKSPADLLLTVDAGNLWFAAQQGLLKPLQSSVLTKNVPAHLMDPQGRWYGLSIRARTIVYNTNKVNPEELSTYEDLASEKWKGRLCLRTSKKVYNRSLVAMMIARHGVEATEEVIKGWVNNLAVAPFSNDTKALKAVAAGRCDVTIANTYYFGRLQRKDSALPLKLYWPNQNKEGVHINISGAGLIKKPGSTAAAQQFVEWLSGQQAQTLLASMNMEYPVNKSVNADPGVIAWGAFKQDSMNMAKAGELQAEAVKLFDRVGYR